jgi:hypothetical protein
MPFGCSGGFQLTKMESPDITRAFTALGASGTAKCNSYYKTQISGVTEKENRKIHQKLVIKFSLLKQ